jgi:hypothetical protein
MITNRATIYNNEHKNYKVEKVWDNDNSKRYYCVIHDNGIKIYKGNYN